jgi:hypothetical protein
LATFYFFASFLWLRCWTGVVHKSRGFNLFFCFLFFTDGRFPLLILHEKLTSRCRT